MHLEHNDSVKSPIWESNLVFKQTLTHVPVQYRWWVSVCENERLMVTVHSIRTICSVGLMSQFIRFASDKFNAANRKPNWSSARCFYTHPSWTLQEFDQADMQKKWGSVKTKRDGSKLKSIARWLEP